MANPAQIKKIHALTGAMKMEDADYRALLSTFGVRSSKRLAIGKADDLIKDLEDKAVALGVWQKRKPARKAGTPRKLADDAQSKKIRALWIQLFEEGKIQNSSEQALAAYVKRMTRVDRLEWLTVTQASTVIEALKKWLARESPTGQTSPKSPRP